MKKTVCVALALLLALLCGCGGNGKSVPSRAGVTSEERQFTAPSDGDLIAIFTTSLGEVRAVLYPDAGLKHYAGALCAAFAAGGDVSGGNSQFYFVTALPDSVDAARQEEMATQGYSEAQIAAYAAAGGLPYLDNTDTVFGQVYAGMDVVDAMACVDTVQDEEGNETWRPTEEAAITVDHVTIATYPGPTAEELAAQSGDAGSEASSEAVG